MYCKNCGAYIPTESSKCEECGTVNGITPLMRLQKAIKNNDSIDDIIEKPAKDDRPIALKRDESVAEETDSETTASADFSEPENNVKQINKEDFSSWSDFDIMGALEFGDDDNVSAEEHPKSNNNIDAADNNFKDFIESLDDLEDNTAKPEISNNSEFINIVNESSKANSGETSDSDKINKSEAEQILVPPTTVSDSNTTSKKTRSVLKPHKKAKKKLPIIAAIIVIIIALTAFLLMKSPKVQSLLQKETTSTSVEVESNSSTTIKQITDAYSYADVYQTTGAEAAQAISGIVNGYQCGQINSAKITDDGKVTLTTDNWEIIFRLKNPNVQESDFLNKSVMVVGSALYNTISAERIYIYNSSDSTEIPTLSVTETTTVLTVADTTTEDMEVSTETETYTETTTERTTNRPETTFRTTAQAPQTDISIDYISPEKANQLMSEWRADGSKLGDSNAYYGIIKEVSVDGDLINIKTATFSIVFTSSDEVNDLVGRNILAVAKPQSNGTVKASQVYIY
jgi:predicted nucleic acid-binding Zn ribbon protein